MRFRRTIATALTVVALLGLAACSLGDDEATTSSTTSSSTTDTSGRTGDQSGDQPGSQTAPAGGGPGGSVDPSSVTTEDQLVALIQEAYGDASLGLHRGHQPVEDVLNEVLGISHDELHVRMEEQGQNLAAVAEDLGIDPQTLIDALVDSWSPAIDNAVAAGAITEAQADDYLAALEDAFTFRVTWDGQEETPTATAIDA